jgi:hypothetical protein
MKPKLISTCVVALICAVAPAVVSADTPGRHPAYLRARTDLRTSQFLLRVHDELNVTRRLEQADREVEAAIHEIDRAALIDRKDIEDHPRIDTSLDRRGRFEKIVALLRSARADLAREEDNGRARGWRNEAYRHIDAALEHMHQAARDQKWDHFFGF